MKAVTGAAAGVLSQHCLHAIAILTNAVRLDIHAPESDLIVTDAQTVYVIIQPRPN